MLTDLFRFLEILECQYMLLSNSKRIRTLKRGCQPTGITERPAMSGQ